MMQLDNIITTPIIKKKVLITGASRGLGRELALVFADNDYDLILHAKENNIATVQRSFRFDRNLTVLCNTVYGDIRNEETLNQLSTIAKTQKVDVLINNAGVYLNKPFSELTIEECKEIIDVNLLAPIALTKKIWPVFQEKKSGLIINISSVASKSASNGESAYCASKYGLRGFFESLQFDATKWNVRIINIILGAMKTDMTKHRKDHEDLIDPKEAAQSIYSACLEFNTMKISELNIGRRIY